MQAKKMNGLHLPSFILNLWCAMTALSEGTMTSRHSLLLENLFLVLSYPQ